MNPPNPALKEMYTEAERVLGGLTPNERTSLEAVTNEIQRIQEELSGVFGEEGMADICRDCGGACCLERVEVDAFSMEYWLFFLLEATEEQRERIKRILESGERNSEGVRDAKGYPTSFCIFNDRGEGCVIPHDLLPPTCKRWFCEERFSGAEELKLEIDGFLLRWLELFDARIPNRFFEEPS